MLNKNPTLKRMLHAALHIPTENWYPGLVWFYQNKDGWNFSSFDSGLWAGVNRTPEELQSCGTLACLAGWLAVDPELNPPVGDTGIPLAPNLLGEKLVRRINRAAAKAGVANHYILWDDLFGRISESRFDSEIPSNRILRQLEGQQRAKMTAVHRIYRVMGYAPGVAADRTVLAMNLNSPYVNEKLS